MVRFHWHVEDGSSAFVPVNGCAVSDGVQHALVEIEVPGITGGAISMFTMPISAHKGLTRSVGVVLAHDTDAAEWQGELLCGLASALAKEGFLVVRNFCALKEARRLKMFERALDAAATSPYARHITSWVLAGLGNGARVAAAVGMKCRGVMSGFVLLSYPLEEAMPASKGAGAPDSSQPIAQARAPLLFVHTEADPLCSLSTLRACCAGAAGVSCRLVVVPAVDAEFKAGGASVPSRVVHKVTKAVVRFVVAVESGTLASCQLPLPSAEDASISDGEGSEDDDAFENDAHRGPSTLPGFPGAALAPSGQPGTLPGLPPLRPAMESAAAPDQHVCPEPASQPLPFTAAAAAPATPPHATQQHTEPRSQLSQFPAPAPVLSSAAPSQAPHAVSGAGAGVSASQAPSSAGASAMLALQSEAATASLPVAESVPDPVSAPHPSPVPASQQCTESEVASQVVAGKKASGAFETATAFVPSQLTRAPNNVAGHAPSPLAQARETDARHLSRDAPGDVEMELF